MQVTIYTDGAAKGNPGPGGFGTLMVSGQHKKSISQGYRLTTNNRMELLAVIVGLRALKKPNTQVLVVSDSKYVVDTVTKGWLQNWRKKGYTGKKNPDLWEAYYQAALPHQVQFKWIKGHNGHPENEFCDQLAVKAAESKELLIDKEYEKVNEAAKNSNSLL
jgi:ribonuclease HI